MGMTAPALYRYFPSLDDLVASMCEDFFEEITESIGVAIAAEGDDGGRAMHAAIRTFRTWAVEHRNEFALMFRHDTGTHADGDSTSRFAAVFFDLYLRLWSDAALRGPGAHRHLRSHLQHDRPTSSADSSRSPRESRRSPARRALRLHPHLGPALRRDRHGGLRAARLHVRRRHALLRERARRRGDSPRHPLRPAPTLRVAGPAQLTCGDDPPSHEPTEQRTTRGRRPRRTSTPLRVRTTRCGAARGRVSAGRAARNAR